VIRTREAASWADVLAAIDRVAAMQEDYRHGGSEADLRRALRDLDRVRRDYKAALECGR